MEMSRGAAAKKVGGVSVASNKFPKPPYFDEITDANGVQHSDSIESALKAFRKDFLENVKMRDLPEGNLDFSLPDEFIKERSVSSTTSITVNHPSKSTDSAVPENKKTKEHRCSVPYPTSCRFCGGLLRAIDKHRSDGLLTLQCRRRECLKYNGVTADKEAKKFLSVIAKPKPPQIDYGWYLSEPAKHAYNIFGADDDSSDSAPETDKSSADVRPIIRDGNIMLRIPGQTTLVRLL